MIKGMTGFGSVELNNGEAKIVVEVKSLNHRYFDISFYLPIGFASTENRLRQMAQASIERGRVTLSLKIIQKISQNISVNQEAVKKYLKYAQLIKKQFNVKNDLTISDLIRLPGVIETKESIVTPDQIWPLLEKGVRQSLDALTRMRAAEGRSLAKDISGKLKDMSSQIKTIRSRAVSISSQKKKIMNAEEFASFQKGNDISEELSRMAHYIEEMQMLLKKTSSVGKQMDFIAQEMQRETNTIGSKLQDKIVSNAVIALKSKIENIREQSQNIE